MSDKTEKAHEVAGKIHVLFMFACELIKDIEYLKQVEKDMRDAESVDAVAPLLIAAGGNYGVERAKADMESKRLKALINMIEVLVQTDKDFKKAKEDDANKKSILQQMGFN